MGSRGLSVSAVFLFAGVLPLLAQADWAVVKKIPVGGEGRWDYLTVDPQTHRLYVPRTTHTMVIDPDSGKVIADIPGQKNAHGVALVPGAGRGFISDGGGEGEVTIFDLKSNAVLGRIPAKPDSDGIIYDPASRLVLVVSGDEGLLMTLKPDMNPNNGKIDTTIDLGGKPEFLASDGAGKVFINLTDKNVVAVVDIGTRKVVARWPVAPGGAPVGMSIDRQKGRLFIGCRNPQKLIVMSTANGRILADLPIGAGVDATRILGNQAFATCRDGSLAVAGETSPDKFAVVETVKTAEGAGTMGLDSGAQKIYLPAAEFEPAKPGAKGRPVPKPGTFMILVLARRAGR